ncbi:hypothetical protein WUBG_11032, partial [Wuchereria bancrofti]
MLDTVDNVRSEYSSALMAHELSRLNIDITAVSEIRTFSKKKIPATSSSGK